MRSTRNWLSLVYKNVGKKVRKEAAMMGRRRTIAETSKNSGQCSFSLGSSLGFFSVTLITDTTQYPDNEAQQRRPKTACCAKTYNRSHCSYAWKFSFSNHSLVSPCKHFLYQFANLSSYKPTYFYSSVYHIHIAKKFTQPTPSIFIETASPTAGSISISNERARGKYFGYAASSRGALHPRYIPRGHVTSAHLEPRGGWRTLTYFSLLFRSLLIFGCTSLLPCSASSIYMLREDPIRSFNFARESVGEGWRDLEGERETSAGKRPWRLCQLRKKRYIGVGRALLRLIHSWHTRDLYSL